MGVTSEERIWSPILDQLVSVTKHWGTYCSLSDRFSFCCFIATHQPEHEKMHFSENCHYLFLSIIISPLRIYYGQERFLDGAGWTWKAWDFYFFFLYLKVQMLLLKSFIWPNGLENHVKIPLLVLSWNIKASAAGFRWSHDMEHQIASKNNASGILSELWQFGWFSSWRFLLMSNLHDMF